ncbi:hypothetical protein WNY63_03540 [Pseudoalteromonas neustonica]|uniref:Uncharacterized protein n=1 Tax=Pseudoalteromonas neustonica TaxID=1840331 RepID=A0ABU9TYF2_9GAMM
MKIVIFFIILVVSFNVFSDMKISTPYVSIINLISSPDEYNKVEIKVAGYFLKTEEGNFLCLNMASCFSRGKERISIRGLSDLDVLKINNCHIGLTGKYLSLNKAAQGHWPLIGFMDVTREYSMSFYDGYEIVNNSCELFNQFQKIKYPKEKR